MRIHHISSAYHQTTLYKALLEHFTAADLDQAMYVPLCKGSKEALRPAPPNAEVITTYDFRLWERFIYPLKRKHVYEGLLCQGFEKADLLHAHFLFSSGGVAYKTWQNYGVPYIVAVRKTDLNTFFKKQPHLRGTGRRILQNASAVIFLTPAARDELLTRWIPEEMRSSLLAKSHVLPNGIDDFWLGQVFEGKAPPEKLSALRLLFVGELTRNKNLEGVFGAMESLREKGWNLSLDIVGEGAHGEALRRIAPKEAVFHGKITDKQRLMQCYRAADIFVMPSFSETFGLVYAEALTQGLPYICSKGQGIDGTFIDGQVGFACDPHAPADIAAKIRAIAENYREMSRAALETAPRFNWASIAAAYEGIYQGIVQGRTV